MKDNYKSLKKGYNLLKKGMSVLSDGPFSFYLKRLIEHSEALLNKYSPYKIGDHIQLSKTLDIDAGHGWYCHRQDLQKGATGIIYSIDYYDNHFRYEVILDIESWFDTNGDKHIVTEGKHTYCLSDDQVERGVLFSLLRK